MQSDYNLVCHPFEITKALFSVLVNTKISHINDCLCIVHCLDVCYTVAPSKWQHVHDTQVISIGTYYCLNDEMKYPIQFKPSTGSMSRYGGEMYLIDTISRERTWAGTWKPDPEQCLSLLSAAVSSQILRLEMFVRMSHWCWFLFKVIKPFNYFRVVFLHLHALGHVKPAKCTVRTIDKQYKIIDKA